jgi:hypothetical protein
MSNLTFRPNMSPAEIMATARAIRIAEDKVQPQIPDSVVEDELAEAALARQNCTKMTARERDALLAQIVAELKRQGR